MALASFAIASDSPVNIDSFDKRPDSLKIRPSAGIRSPSRKITISPGTSSVESIAISSPLRLTSIVCVVLRFKDARMRSVEKR